MGVGNLAGAFERNGFSAVSWTDQRPEPSVPPQRGVVLSDGLLAFERAVDGWALLRAGLQAASFPDDMAGLESCREALSLGGTAPTPADLLQLLTTVATEDRPPPRELRAAFQRLEAIRSGLHAARLAGRPALNAELLFEISAKLGGRGLAGRDLPRAQQAGEAIDRLLAETLQLPLLVRAAMLTARIEIAAPFGAASPMLARLALPLLAAAEGRPPLFLSDSLLPRQNHYDQALAALAPPRAPNGATHGAPNGATLGEPHGTWEGWIAFHASLVADAAEAALRRLREAERLRGALARELETLRSHSNAHRLADLAVTMPVMTVGMAQQSLGVSFQTANAAIAALVKLGVLRPQSSVRRNRMFMLAGLAATAA
jgi:hypothetical protein